MLRTQELNFVIVKFPIFLTQQSTDWLFCPTECCSSSSNNCCNWNVIWARLMKHWM